MEGAGEGVVAILQGTKHSGLRVTVVPDSRLRLRRKCLLINSDAPPTHVTQSSVETNTERILKNASSPKCDVRYATTYRFANCKSVQSSLRFSEFSRHSTFYRNSDQFVESLRKYPAGAASSEILQRVINYTNTKLCNRKSNLRKTRSLRSKPTIHQMSYDKGANTNYEINARKKLDEPISTIGKRYSSQKELSNYTYDYLKRTPLIPRCTDVRYLAQIKKCLQNKILEMIYDEPIVCPGLRSRYSHHRRHFHGRARDMTSHFNNRETSDSMRSNKLNNASFTNPSHSGHKSCSCEKPTNCVCKRKSNKMDALESLMTKLYPDLLENKNKMTSRHRVIDSKKQTRGQETLNIHDGLDDEIISAVTDWLRTIPVFPHFNENDKLEQEKLAHKLAENLCRLKNQEDFIQKAETEIMACVNDLPIWHPSDSTEKAVFFERTVSDLVYRLKNILREELNHTIAKMLPILRDRGVDIEDELLNEIKSIGLQGPDGDMEALRKKILETLKVLPTQSTPEEIHELTDKLVNQLLQLRFEKSQSDVLRGADDNKFRENILSFCKNVPELENIKISENLIDELVSKFEQYESRGPNDENVRAGLMEDVQNWVDEVANKMNIPLNTKTKNSLCNRIIEHVLGAEDYDIPHRRKSSEFDISEEDLKPLLKWYHGIQELKGGNTAENKKALNGLAKELIEIQSRDSNFESMIANMREAISEWLQNMLLQRGKSLESKDFDNLVNKLLLKVNDPKRRNRRGSGAYGQFYRDIESWIRDISYLKPNSHIQQNAIAKLVRRLQNIRRSVDSTTQINDAVEKFIQDLSKNTEEDVDDTESDMLKAKIFQRRTQASKKRKRWDNIKDSYQPILSEISKSLQAYSNSLGNTNLINLTEKLFSVIIRNIEENGLPDWDYVLYEINDILERETNLNKQMNKDLATNITARLQRVFSQDIAQESTVLSHPSSNNGEQLSLSDKNLEVAKKQKKQKRTRAPSIEISLKGKDVNKWGGYRGNNHQAGDARKSQRDSTILSSIFQSSNTELDVQDSRDNRYNSVSKSKPSELTENKYFQTSTPTTSKIRRFPKEFRSGSPIVNVTEDTENLSLDREHSEQTKYLLKLKNVITGWLKDISALTLSNLDLNNAVDRIASDIIDRQKYLQLSGSRYSESDELENLKYQIFRQLNKLDNFENMPQIMSKINNLNHLIRNINVPDLFINKKSTKVPSTIMEDNSIIRKINQWLDSIPPNLLESNISKHELVEGLAKRLEDLEKGNNHEYQIQKEILMWLPKILRNVDDKICQELAESFKLHLHDTLFSNTDVLKKEASEFIDEDILEVIVEWLKRIPFNTSSSEDRLLQRRLTLMLASNLKKNIQSSKVADNINDLLIEEVKKYLKTIPIDVQFRNDDFYDKAAAELVEHLKLSIPIIKDIFDRTSNINPIRPYKSNISDIFPESEDIKDIVNNWCDNLPIHLGHSPEDKEQEEQLKQNIAKKLLEKLNILYTDAENSNVPFDIMLIDEINDIFKNVPMNRELEKGLPVLKSILIDKLKEAKKGNKNLDNKKLIQDTLTKTLQEIENTPDMGSSSFNLLKEKLANAFLNLHNHGSDDELRAKLKDKLHYEINEFCDEYLQRHPNTPLDPQELRYNLYNTLKKVLIPDINRQDVSEETSKRFPENKTPSRNTRTHHTGSQILPSALSSDDRAHLERIRKRAAGYNETENLSHLVEDSVQTDNRESIEETAQTSKTMISERSSFNREMLPQVVIKEFYWDSSGSTQSLEMFVPPALSPHIRLPRNKETIDSQNQTDQSLYKDIVSEVTKVDKALNVVWEDVNPRQQASPSKSPEAKSQNDDYTLSSSKESTQRQKRTEKTYQKYYRKRINYSSKGVDCKNFERYWYDQPRIENDRCARRECGQRRQVDSVAIPDDIRVLGQRKCWIPERINNECCGRNWRMGPNFCRQRCNNKFRHCSKCRDVSCPYPSFAFFKKDF